MGKALGIIGGAFLAFVLFLVILFGGAISEDANPPADTGEVGTASGGLQAAGLIPAAWMDPIKQAGSKCPEVTPAIIAAQTFQESGFKDHPPNGAGAAGPSQFIPSTWAAWGKDYDHDGRADIHNFKDSIPSQGDLMCDFVKQIKVALKSGRVKGDVVSLALASYNCGFGCVLDAHGLPTNAETAAYVPNILKLAKKFEAPGGVALPGGVMGKIIAAAISQSGKPYIYGGGGPGVENAPGLDCSGLTTWAIWKGTGGKLSLPHYTGALRLDPHLSQLVSTKPGDVSKLQPGDVIFYNIPSDPAPWGHVNIYVGGGKAIDAAKPGTQIKINPVSSGYYATVPWEVRRLKM